MDLASIISHARAEWQDRAACRGVLPELFYPERGASTGEAKAICRACDVRRECLTMAINNGEKFGIWGGMSERERRRIRRKANLRVAPQIHPDDPVEVRGTPRNEPLDLDDIPKVAS